LAKKKPVRLKTGARYKTENRIPVNKAKWTGYGSYDVAPEYYSDQEFRCCDCDSNEIWTAQQQKYYYEGVRENIYATTMRCRKCRTYNEAVKEDQKRHMEKMVKEEPHLNEKYLKKNT